MGLLHCSYILTVVSPVLAATTVLYLPGLLLASTAFAIFSMFLAVRANDFAIISMFFIMLDMLVRCRSTRSDCVIGVLFVL